MVKTNAAIYIRKSSDDGTSSSDEQLHDLTTIAKRHELTAVGFGFLSATIRAAARMVSH